MQIAEELENGSISMNDFLDFLKITCQVNETIDDSNKNKKAIIDYDQLANNELVNIIVNKSSVAPKQSSISLGEREISKKIQTSNVKEFKEKGSGSSFRRNSKTSFKNPKSKQDERIQLHPVLNEKLDEVINEGILDSVLPFICPPKIPSSHNLTTNFQNITSKSSKQNQQTIGSKTNIQLQVLNGGDDGNKTNSPIGDHSPLDHGCAIVRKMSRGSDNLMPSKDRNKRKSSISLISGDLNKSDLDVIIHVCDEVKNISKDFTCPQKLLISKMGYFADVTAGQRLEDMDISVHCDIQIFEWLMKWVKRESLPQPEWPSLDPTNVVPILVSASFLQMEPLLLDCLSFCHARLNDIVKASANLSCLNDSIITRLSAMFTNLELELVRDKKDRVVPRLWTKMIQSLCELEPQSLRGHFASLASLFRCNRCGKYLTQAVSSYVYCLPQNMRLNRWGQLVGQHTRDVVWNVTNYIATLYKELKSWRKVYWRLWGHCHFLFCISCETHFAVYQMNWCQFHPDQPQFLGPISEGRTAGPAGRYPCCGQQAFRYETMPGPTGCLYREHTVQIDNERDRAILHLAQVAAEGGCLFESAPSKVQAQGNGNSDSWWTGMALLPHRSRQGLLPSLHVDDTIPRNNNNKKCATRQNSILLDSSSETESSDNPKDAAIIRQPSYSSDGAESEYSSPRQYRSRISKRRTKLPGGRYWSGEMSARSNQDNQREFEERIMKQVIVTVGKKNGDSETYTQFQNFQQGGSYIKLEYEWRENLKNRNATNKSKTQK